MSAQPIPGTAPIGVFDSGYGGMTILRQFKRLLPQYDYLYLGDNARAPYGSHSFEVIYQYTLEAVEALFKRGCPLVILACNTASAKALRTLQQNDLPARYPDRRVLGVIRPTVETVAGLTQSHHIGLLGTVGTISSGSYTMEFAKIDPSAKLTGMACPMWVPLVENYEFDSPGADYFVRKRLDALFKSDPQIDTLILGCTHYPLLLEKISQFTPPNVKIVEQGAYVAEKLQDYLQRHPEMEVRLSRQGSCKYLTTESVDKFDEAAHLFMNEKIVDVSKISLPEASA